MVWWASGWPHGLTQALDSSAGMERSGARGWPWKTQTAESTGPENSLPDVLKVLIITHTVRARET